MTTIINWERTTEERYCVDSGRAVSLIPGDRCIDHGDGDKPCYTTIRNPRCMHELLSPNHPYPKCQECGRVGTRAFKQKGARDIRRP